MPAEPRADALEPRLAGEVERDAAALAQRDPVELEPARGTATRQAAAGYDDVGIAARRGKCLPVDAVAAALVRVGGDNPYRSLGRALVVMARAA